MNSKLSLYLDLVRFSAAVVVFLGHLSAQRLTGGFLWQFSAIADDAVVVFFVLSGYVIAWVTHARHATAADYVVARASRIYSVAVPAVLLTFALDTVGTLIDPGAYVTHVVDQNRPLWWEVVSSLTFLNQIWYLSTDIGSMLPYWSLGYEVWYYVLFGLAVFIADRRRAWLWVGSVLLFVGPRIAVLFPLWLLGVLLYRTMAHRPVSTRVGALAFAASVLLYALYLWQGRHWLAAHDAVSPWVGEKSILNRYAVAAIFGLNLVGAVGLSHLRLRVQPRLEHCVRRCAETTFTVYLVHLPVAHFLSTVTPWPATDAANRVFMFVGTGAIVAVMAVLCEQRKGWWAHGLRRLLFARRGLQP
ncbi:acyltransferase [Pseudorhodoferax sp. Leaf267]|uniref:acyltransferase family protein n=1 Tax=Pseudorhodoferax sp. Leaf267 TaxID=1736316 RepID=UPI000701D6C9|nr:acyltransferase [Pseudorhodoferax sp. Leaf267]KQP23109.1 hypothetical protein ASF43_04285 [Pseudorhodoferax sp. Leaf267]